MSWRKLKNLENNNEIITKQENALVSTTIQTKLC